MKKALLFCTLLIGFFVQAQNIELLKQANMANLEFTKKLSDEIVSGAKNQYVYLQTKESKHLQLLTYVYIKKGLTSAETKSIEAYLYNYTGRYELQFENTLCVHFKESEKGSKVYSFDSVKGEYDELFSFYQKNIEPTATAEKSVTSGIYSVRKDKDGYWYNFAKSGSDGLWYLKNMSSRLN